MPYNKPLAEHCWFTSALAARSNCAISRACEFELAFKQRKDSGWAIPSPATRGPFGEARHSKSFAITSGRVFSPLAKAMTGTFRGHALLHTSAWYLTKSSTSFAVRQHAKSGTPDAERLGFAFASRRILRICGERQACITTMCIVVRPFAMPTSGIALKGLSTEQRASRSNFSTSASPVSAAATTGLKLLFFDAFSDLYPKFSRNSTMLLGWRVVPMRVSLRERK